MAPAELVQERPGRLVAQPELALQLDRRQPRCVSGYQVRGPEPDRQRHPRPMQDRARRRRSLPIACLALPEPPARQLEGARRPAVPAAKPLGPPARRQVRSTPLVVPEPGLKLLQGLGEIRPAHPAILRMGVFGVNPIDRTNEKLGARLYRLWVGLEPIGSYSRRENGEREEPSVGGMESAVQIARANFRAPTGLTGFFRLADPGSTRRVGIASSCWSLPTVIAAEADAIQGVRKGSRRGVRVTHAFHVSAAAAHDRRPHGPASRTRSPEGRKRLPRRAVHRLRPVVRVDLERLTRAMQRGH
jgi:hypothetical protein